MGIVELNTLRVDDEASLIHTVLGREGDSYHSRAVSYGTPKISKERAFAEVAYSMSINN